MNLVRSLNQVHEFPHSGASVRPKLTILVKERTRIDYRRRVELWHVSENGSIPRFEPRSNPEHDSQETLVWAIDDAHVPAYWFPRDLPRGTFWAIDTTTDDDVERFLTGDRTRRVHVIEASWLTALRDGRVFAYRLPSETFEPYGRAAGYFVSREPVEPIEVVELDDLIARHAEAGIELRMVPELWPLWERVIASTLEFSGIRLRNLQSRT
jgi:hypothetical protein